MKDEKINIGIIDNSKVIIEGISAILAEFNNFAIALTAYNGDELLKQLGVKKADVLILDFEMPPGLNGKELSEIIKAQYPNTAILILSMHDDLEIIQSCLEAGVDGYLLKEEAGMNELHDAISCVMKNGTYFSKTIFQKITDFLGKPNDEPKPEKQILNDELTKREKEILLLICKGYTTKEIAKRLFRAINTIEAHRRNMKEKIGCENIVGMVFYAIRIGLIPNYYYNETEL